MQGRSMIYLAVRIPFSIKSFIPFCQSMQKGTKKIFVWQNAFRLAVALERLPAEAEFFVLAFGSIQYRNILYSKSQSVKQKCLILAVRQLADLSEAVRRNEFLQSSPFYFHPANNNTGYTSVYLHSFWFCVTTLWLPE